MLVFYLYSVKSKYGYKTCQKCVILFSFNILYSEGRRNWKVVEYTFETVKNIYEYGSEFWPTIREGIRAWNRTVQYWLASFVYKRIKAPKPVK